MPITPYQPCFLLLMCGAAAAQPCGQPWTMAVGGPPARLSHGMVYDSLRDVVVMVGGRHGSTLPSDTWEWDAHGGGGTGAWTLRGTGGPAARFGMGLAYDSLRGRTVLFGGTAGAVTLGDTWEWDGASWELHNSGPGAPPAR